MGCCCLEHEFIGTQATMYAVRLSDGVILYAFDCLSRMGGEGSGGSCDTNSSKVFNVASRSGFGFSIAAYDKTTYENLWINDIVDDSSSYVSESISLYADDSYVWIAEPNGRAWCYDQSDGTEVGTLESDDIPDYLNIMAGTEEGKVCFGARVEYDHEFTVVQSSTIIEGASPILTPANTTIGTAIDIGVEIVAAYKQASRNELHIFTVEKGDLANPFHTFRSTIQTDNSDLMIADSSQYVITGWGDDVDPVEIPVGTAPGIQLRNNREAYSVNGPSVWQHSLVGADPTSPIPVPVMSSDSVFGIAQFDNIAKYARVTTETYGTDTAWSKTPGVGSSHLTALFDNPNSQAIGIGSPGEILRALADDDGETNWEADLVGDGLRLIDEGEIVFAAVQRHQLEDSLPDSE